MKRNCSKRLVTLVGSHLPTLSFLSSGTHRLCNCCFASYRCCSTYLNCSSNAVSRDHNTNGNCKCSLPPGLVNRNEGKNSNNNNAKKSSSAHSFHWKAFSTSTYHLPDPDMGAVIKYPLFSSPTFHAITGTGARWYNSSRCYSTSGNNNDEDLIEVLRMSDKVSPFPSAASQLHNNRHKNLQNDGHVENTQVEWDSHLQKNTKNDYCSTATNNKMQATTTFPSSPALQPPTTLGRLVHSNVTSRATGPSTSASPTIFGMIAGTVASSNFTPVRRTVVTSQRLVEVTRENMDQPKLMSKEEREEFMSVYHQLVKELVEIPDMKDMEETNRWLARVMQYNVPHGKRNRGLSTALAYKYLAPEELTEENIRLSYVLGWCVEILQAYFLVSDDIMDGSETRRGRPCWYKVDNLGLAAVNDALLLESVIYAILRKHFSDKPYYAKVMEVMHDVTYKTVFGQSLDTRTGQDRRMETYTMDRYSSIVKYKTSYYSFYLPVALAMTMCEITDPNCWQQVRKVTLEMGHFFQVQDDYLDCFGDVEVTGKVGTDIQDCKCSWLFVVAMQMCNTEQKKFLLENYGKHDPDQVEAIKKLYRELDMQNVYNKYEEHTYNMIVTHIKQMDEVLPKGLFFEMLHKIYKRSS